MQVVQYFNSGGDLDAAKLQENISIYHSYHMSIPHDFLPDHSPHIKPGWSQSATFDQ